MPTNSNLAISLDLRSRLLAAAEDACATEGLYDARIEDVTRRAGIAKGTFYLYFASKEAIVHAVVQEALRELGDRCRKSVGGTSTRPERVRALVAAHLEFYAQRPGRMRILHQARGALKFNRSEWEPLRRALEGHLATIADLLGLPARLQEGDRREVARLLFGATAGICSTWAATDPSGRSRVPIECADLVAGLVLEFVGARRPARGEAR